MPVYEARDQHKTLVQIVGEENIIRQAKWTYTFTTDRELNKKLVMNVAYFAYIFDRNKMPDWIKKETELLSKDLLKEYVGKKELALINGLS